MGNPVYEKLVKELFEFLPENPELIYVHQGDGLTREQVNMLIAGNDLWEDMEYEEWYFENRRYGADHYIEEAMESLRTKYADNEMVSEFIDLSEYELETAAYDELCERDESDPARDLAWNTPDAIVEVTLLGDGEDVFTVDGLLKALAFEDTISNRIRLEELVAEAPTELGMAQAVFNIPVIDLYEGDKDSVYTVKSPYIEYGNLFTGGTWMLEFPDVELVVRQGDMKPNGTIGYSVKDTYGFTPHESTTERKEMAA